MFVCAISNQDAKHASKYHKIAIQSVRAARNLDGRVRIRTGYNVRSTQFRGADLLELTSEAREYAFRELARRSGVAPELLDSWKIETTPERTTVTLDARSSRSL